MASAGLGFPGCRRIDDPPGGSPTVPLDPPTAYGVAALLVLAGTRLIRAGRGAVAFKGAVAFTLIFAVSVQWFLFRWPDWMYAYFIPVQALPPAWVSPFFFLAMLGAGMAGAFVSWTLVRERRIGWAIANVSLGLGGWLAIQAATWDRYFHVGTWAEYHAGTAPRLSEAGSFPLEMNVAGAIQAVAGIGIAVALVKRGRLRLSRSLIQPDPVAPWRPELGMAVAASGEAAAVVGKARQAQAIWARLDPDQRARRLQRLGKAFLLRAEEAAAILETELGRPGAESWFTELLPNADLFEHWTHRGLVELQPTSIGLDPLSYQGKQGIIERVPLGVVMVISPWNFPLSLPLRTIVPALLAGNAVVLKPSEHSPRINAFLAEVCSSVLGPDLVAVVEGGAAQARALIETGVDFISFVGSPGVGRKVAELAARQLTPVSLELGGKDAALVRADAELERAANGIVWGAFANAGQNCAAIERCYVDRRVMRPFVGKLQEKVAALRVGLDMGRIATEEQRNRVMAQLEEARSRGVQVDIREGDRFLLEPILLVDPPEDLALLREETFGPVLCVVGVKGDEELVKRANDSPFGLTASVWSRDLAKAEALGRRLHAGVITVNNHAFTGALAQAPWGGVKGSGGGITGGPDMLSQLTRPRLVLVDKLRRRRELWWHPYDETAWKLGRDLGKLRSGRAESVGGVASAYLRRLFGTPAHPSDGSTTASGTGVLPEPVSISKSGEAGAGDGTSTRSTGKV